MSADFKRTLLYSLISASTLCLVTSSVVTHSVCANGNLCFNPANNTYGFPLPFFDASFHVVSYLKLLLNFSFYYVTSLVLVTVCILIIHYFARKPKILKQIKKFFCSPLFVIVASCVSLVIIFVSLFYFYPTPKSLEKAAKNGGHVERCIYYAGIGYKAEFELESFQAAIFSTIFYNVRGEEICSASNFTGQSPAEVCKIKLCFPVYDQRKD